MAWDNSWGFESNSSTQGKKPRGKTLAVTVNDPSYDPGNRRLVADANMLEGQVKSLDPNTSEERRYEITTARDIAVKKMRERGLDYNSKIPTQPPRYSPKKSHRRKKNLQTSFW